MHLVLTDSLPWFVCFAFRYMKKPVIFKLWEMACVRQLGLSQQRIVCLNIEGYYDPFQTMLERADRDGLLHRPPEDIVHFEETPEAAIRWIEDEKVGLHYHEKEEEEEKVYLHVKQRAAVLKKASYLHDPPTREGKRNTALRRPERPTSASPSIGNVIYLAMALATGVVIGVSLRRSKV
jgi:hypothetical protein